MPQTWPVAPSPHHLLQFSLQTVPTEAQPPRPYQPSPGLDCRTGSYEVKAGLALLPTCSTGAQAPSTRGSFCPLGVRAAPHRSWHTVPDLCGKPPSSLSLGRSLSLDLCCRFHHVLPVRRPRHPPHHCATCGVSTPSTGHVTCLANKT